MTHRGPFQPLPVCDSVICKMRSHLLRAHKHTHSFTFHFRMERSVLLRSDFLVYVSTLLSVTLPQKAEGPVLLKGSTFCVWAFKNCCKYSSSVSRPMRCMCRVSVREWCMLDWASLNFCPKTFAVGLTSLWV